MKLFANRSPEPNAGSADPHHLGDRGLLARWFIFYRLVEEVDRAARYGRPLAVMVARPDLLPGERLAPGVLEQAATTALRTARSTDLAGWMNDDSILIIMPETGRRDAQVAVHRWQNEMWLITRASSGCKWDVRMLDRLEDFATVERFHESFGKQHEAA